METQFADTLILSDVHLGSEVSRARSAVRLLKQHVFRRLILLGDIFCDLNFHRLKKDHWQFLSHIRKLSNPKREIEVVWVEGNHDRGLTDVMAHLVGVRVYQEYAWEFDGLRHLAIHGHQFDRFLMNNALVSRLGASAYLHLLKLKFRQKPLAHFLDGLNTRWLRLTAKVSSGALAQARARGFDRVFCGHTHVAAREESGGVAYYNSGCWTGDTATYITIDHEGAHIHEYLEPADHRDPGQERGEADWALADFPDDAGLPADAEYERVGG
ncbi:MAG: UDP-2,3-diacylglucosamine diphosphatase [Terriglobales bacterium]